MEINLYLSNKRAKKTIIRLYIHVNGREYVSIPEKISPAMWDFESQRLITKGKLTDIEKAYNSRVNDRLEGYIIKAKKIYNRYRDEDESEFTAYSIAEELRSSMGIKRKEDKKSTTFWDIVNEMLQIAGEREPKKKRNGEPSKTQNSLYTSYSQTIRVLKDYQIFKKCSLDFNSFDATFYHRFMHFMATQKKFKANTSGKHIKTLKTFCERGYLDGINKKLIYKTYRVYNIETDVIALTGDEVKAISKLKLTGNMENQRDLFLIGCYSGLRYSDFGFLKPQNFKDGCIIKMQKKKLMQTQKPVMIPIRPELKKILEKYNYILPPAAENQNINAMLKEIGKMAEITEETFYNEYMIDGVIEKSAPRYEKITTHTARRTFATLLNKSGFPDSETMKITGHKSEAAFRRYIRSTPDESANRLKKHWGIEV